MTVVPGALRMLREKQRTFSWCRGLPINSLASRGNNAGQNMGPQASASIDVKLKV